MFVVRDGSSAGALQQVTNEFAIDQARCYVHDGRRSLSRLFRVHVGLLLSVRRNKNRMTTSQAWRDYPSVQKKMHDVCKAVLLQRHAECSFSHFPDGFRDLIETS